MTPREVALAYLAAFATGDPDAIAALVTEDFVNEHTAALGRGCEGRDEYRSRLPGFLASFADLRYEVEDVVTEASRVVAAYTMTARWQGEHPVSIRGVMRFTMRDGLIAHRTDYWDAAGFLAQADPAAAAALAPFGV